MAKPKYFGKLEWISTTVGGRAVRTNHLIRDDGTLACGEGYDEALSIEGAPTHPCGRCEVLLRMHNRKMEAREAELQKLRNSLGKLRWGVILDRWHDEQPTRHLLDERNAPVCGIKYFTASSLSEEPHEHSKCMRCKAHLNKLQGKAEV